MNDPRTRAERLLGAIDWQSAVSGFCRCLSAAQHTTSSSAKDCRVSIDGAPTIHCFHASCAPAVAEANRRSRQELGAVSWEMEARTDRHLTGDTPYPASGHLLPSAEKEIFPIKAEREKKRESVFLSVRVMDNAFTNPEYARESNWVAETGVVRWGLGYCGGSVLHDVPKGCACD